MNCQRCGYQIPDTAAFCPNCGAQKPAVNSPANAPQQAAQTAQYPPNPYLQTPYPQQQGNPPQAYQQPQPPFQQNPYQPQHPQPSYTQKPPVREQSKAVRILIVIAAILSMIVGLLKIFRVFR